MKDKKSLPQNAAFFERYADQSKEIRALTFAAFDDYMQMYVIPLLERIATTKDETTKEPFADYPEFLTRKQTAEILGISSPSVDRWASEGRFKKISVHGSPRYRKTEIVKFKTLGR